MGHTRLGTVPKTRKWNEIVEQISGPGLTGDVAAAVKVGAIAARTLDAAQKGLDKGIDDSGVRYTFYLSTQGLPDQQIEALRTYRAKRGVNKSIRDLVSRTNRSKCGLHPAPPSHSSIPRNYSY